MTFVYLYVEACMFQTMGNSIILLNTSYPQKRKKEPQKEHKQTNKQNLKQVKQQQQKYPHSSNKR